MYKPNTGGGAKIGDILLMEGQAGVLQRIGVGQHHDTLRYEMESTTGGEPLSTSLLLVSGYDVAGELGVKSPRVSTLSAGEKGSISEYAKIPVSELDEVADIERQILSPS